MCGPDPYYEIENHKSQVEYLGKITDLIKEDYTNYLDDDELKQVNWIEELKGLLDNMIEQEENQKWINGVICECCTETFHNPDDIDDEGTVIWCNACWQRAHDEDTNRAGPTSHH